jgi:hypothetical protein
MSKSRGVNSEQAASLVEYVLLLALVALIAVPSTKLVGRGSAKPSLIVSCSLHGNVAMVVCENAIILDTCIDDPSQALCGFVFGL